MSERESHTFSIPKGYDGVSGFNGAALLQAILQEVERLFLDRRAAATHLFVSEPDYTLVSLWLRTFTEYAIEGSTIVTKTRVEDEKVTHVMNTTTGTPMHFSISPKLNPGTCAVLHHPWKRGEQ